MAILVDLGFSASLVVDAGASVCASGTSATASGADGATASDCCGVASNVGVGRDTPPWPVVTTRREADAGVATAPNPLVLAAGLDNDMTGKGEPASSTCSV